MRPQDGQDDAVRRAVLNARGLEAMRREHTAFFALLAASPDAAAAAASLAVRFDVSLETAADALQQHVVAFLPHEGQR